MTTHGIYMNSDGPFSILFSYRHAWLIFIIITSANAAMWWFRSRPEIAKNPALESGYRRLILGLLIFGNIPWLILGAALELPPAFSDPLLIAFSVAIVVYWIAGLYWLVFRGGAEYLAAHPGIFRGTTPAPRTIKVDVLGLAGTAFLVTGLAIGSFVRDAGPMTSVFVVIAIIISGFVFSGKPWVRL